MSGQLGRTPSTPFRNRLNGLVLLVLGGVIVLGATTAIRAQETAAAERVMIIDPSEIYEVNRGDLQQTVHFTGTAQPSHRADISAQVSGIATAVNVLPGQSVVEGDILMEIDTTDLRLQLQVQLSTKASTQAQLDAARQTLERTRSSTERGLTPQTGLDSAAAEVERLEATLASLEAQVEQVQANLERAEIHAPFDGIVASRSVEVGQLVNSGSAVFSIVDLSQITVDALVPLSSSSWVQTGQTAQLSIHGMAGRSFEAIVDRINPVAEQGTRSVVVYLALDNEDQHLRGGMFVTGDIVTAQSPDALAVPVRALTEGEDGQSVLAIEDGVAVSRAVQTGTRWDNLGLVEIVSGLDDGAVVLAAPLSGLAPGQAVRVED